ncbi:hypothetical protein SAMD00019534_053590 [Acytostelium subglobosum LB1]|uniref:hypothetical protein n=1 Tax=Acytostelium subglobosum LB1 TaxID=1410327 RepID=UPI000644E484|nr:hypothetical protein SAMD00019534_053590 [Acytostelium subglobosum LB1]GAM22184.1 hypothetical protein SAMD00019534_053590 [Acytostelium subglobosum LB1]|eukprot:XP_012755284.1 hypothetical protein SAMD00019534_053590 [Acytostelium subglobosum LB1]
MPFPTLAAPRTTDDGKQLDRICDHLGCLERVTINGMYVDDEVLVLLFVACWSGDHIKGAGVDAGAGAGADADAGAGAGGDAGADPDAGVCVRPMAANSLNI